LARGVSRAPPTKTPLQRYLQTGGEKLYERTERNNLDEHHSHSDLSDKLAVQANSICLRCEWMISSLIRIGAFVPEDGANKVSIGGFLAACLRCSPHPQTLFSFFGEYTCGKPGEKLTIFSFQLSQQLCSQQTTLSCFFNGLPNVTKRM
jgi:hypothetical protein